MIFLRKQLFLFGSKVAVWDLIDLSTRLGKATVDGLKGQMKPYDTKFYVHHNYN